jgi:hypothetical protein
VNRDLRWLLRRYRDGGRQGWEMAHALEHELRGLYQESSSLRLEVSGLGGAVPGRVVALDGAINTALQYCLEIRYEPALSELREAGGHLRELQRVAGVARELATEKQQLDDLETLLGSELADLATPRCLCRLYGLARELLEKDEPRKARFVAVYLRDELARLRRRSPGRDGTLRRVLLSLDARHEAEPAAARLLRLLEEGYSTLTARLAEDLEVELSIRRHNRQIAHIHSVDRGGLRQTLEKICRDSEALRTSLAEWVGASEMTEI